MPLTPNSSLESDKPNVELISRFRMTLSPSLSRVSISRFDASTAMNESLQKMQCLSFCLILPSSSVAVLWSLLGRFRLPFFSSGNLQSNLSSFELVIIASDSLVFVRVLLFVDWTIRFSVYLIVRFSNISENGRPVGRKRVCGFISAWNLSSGCRFQIF